MRHDWTLFDVDAKVFDALAACSDLMSASFDSDMFRRCLVHLGSIFGSSSCLVCLDWCLQKPSNVLPLETVKPPFGISSRACLWKVQQLLLQNQLPYWGEPGLHLKVCISCERVRPEPPCLPWCMPKGPCTLKQT